MKNIGKTGDACKKEKEKKKSAFAALWLKRLG